MKETMTPEITEYQKQKFRDLSSAVNKHLTNQQTIQLPQLTLLIKQAIPYSTAPLHATNYAQATLNKETIYTNWVEETNPTLLENLIFHIVICIHDLYSDDINVYQTAVEDWGHLNTVLMTHIDGNHWDTYLSDVDKLRELNECLNSKNLQTFFNLNEATYNQALTGENQFEEKTRVKLDVLHRIFEQASYTFQVPAFVNLWFTSPDELTNITPLEYISQSPQEAKTNLILKLKNQPKQES